MQSMASSTSREDARKLLNEAAILRAIKQKLQNRIRDEYEAAYQKKSPRSQRVSNQWASVRAEKRKALYAREKKTLVIPRVSDDMEFATPNEVRACKLVPLFSRDLRDRLEFWRKALDGDVLASHVGRGLAIVDVR